MNTPDVVETNKLILQRWMNTPTAQAFIEGGSHARFLGVPASDMTENQLRAFIGYLSMAEDTRITYNFPTIIFTEAAGQ